MRQTASSGTTRESSGAIDLAEIQLGSRGDLQVWYISMDTPSITKLYIDDSYRRCMSVPDL